MTGGAGRSTVFRTIVGFYGVVLTQLIGWMVVVALLTAGATVLAGIVTEPTSINDSLLIGTWVAILAGGPVAITATAVCMRRYLKKGDWPAFDRTARLFVTGAWVVMAIVLGAGSNSIWSGLPWYGLITLGVWGVAPLMFRLAPTGAVTSARS